MNTSNIPRLLTLDMILEHFVPVSRSTLYEMISRGTFPAATKRFGRKQRLWLREVVAEWAETPQTINGKDDLDVA